jgi:hypothetical protein
VTPSGGPTRLTDVQEPGTTPTTAPEQVAPVLRLRPIRTLVVSRDLDYRDRALTVISQLGPTAFAVGTLADPEDLLSLVVAERADVVVLDATDCERDVAAVVRRLAEPLPRVGIVVVCHHCTAAARKLNALPKWGWTQDLRSGVERAYGEGNPLRPRLVASPRRDDSQRQPGLRPLTRR